MAFLGFYTIFIKPDRLIIKKKLFYYSYSIFIAVIIKNEYMWSCINIVWSKSKDILKFNTCVNKSMS